MPSRELGPVDLGAQLSRKMVQLVTLLDPPSQDNSRTLSFKSSLQQITNNDFLKGNMDSDVQRGNLRVVNAAIKAARGINRLMESGGVVDGGEIHWKRSLPGQPETCIEFTVNLS